MSDLPPYDPAAVVAAARAADPGLTPETAEQLAGDAARHLQEGAADAPDLARRLLDEHPEHGASAAAVVARAVFGGATA